VISAVQQEQQRPAPHRFGQRSTFSLTKAETACSSGSAAEQLSCLSCRIRTQRARRGSLTQRRDQRRETRSTRCATASVWGVLRGAHYVGCCLWGVGCSGTCCCMALLCQKCERAPPPIFPTRTQTHTATPSTPVPPSPHTHTTHSAEDEGISDLLEGSRGLTEAVRLNAVLYCRWSGSALYTALCSGNIQVAMTHQPHPH